MVDLEEVDPPFDDLLDRSQPLFPVFDPHGCDPNDGPDDPRRYQYCVERQAYSRGRPEFTIKRKSFDLEFERYTNATWNPYTGEGRAIGYRPGGGKRGPRDPSVVRSAESLKRAGYRAKKTVRRKVIELQPDTMVTFTGRGGIDPARVVAIWARFVRLAGVAVGLGRVRYVAIAEWCPSMPGRVHIHAAWSGRTPFKVLRRLWQSALLWDQGIRCTRTLYGAESPGNIRVSARSYCKDPQERARRIARYVGKYLAKSLDESPIRRDGKRYWQSSGLTVEPPERLWLEARTMAQAINEVSIMFGMVEGVLVLPSWWRSPDGRIAWCAPREDDYGPPPF